MKPDDFIVRAMTRIASVSHKLCLKEFLDSTLTPYGLRNAENCIFLGCSNRHPFLDQGSMQFFKFVLIFPRENPWRAKGPVLICVGAFPFLFWHGIQLLRYVTC